MVGRTHSQFLHLDPLLGVFFEQPDEQVSQIVAAGTVKLEGIRPYRLVQLNHAVLLERNPAEDQAVQRAAHGPDVGSTTRDMAVLCDTQLRRHERRRASRLCGLHLAVLVEHFRNAKVDNLEHVVVGDEAVVGLDVAVDDALGVN
jgi:hypothetical protein